MGMHGVDGIFWSKTCQNIPSKLLGTSLNQLKFIIPLISDSLPERMEHQLVKLLKDLEA